MLYFCCNWKENKIHTHTHTPRPQNAGTSISHVEEAKICIACENKEITEESVGDRAGVKTSQALPSLQVFPLFYLARFHLSHSSVSILGCLVWLHIACLVQFILDIHCSLLTSFLSSELIPP